MKNTKTVLKAVFDESKWEWKLKRDPIKKTISSVESELKDLQEMLGKERSEVKDLEKKNSRLQTMRLAQAESLISERVDLMARVLRIDQRILALGFNPLPTLKHFEAKIAPEERP